MILLIYHMISLLCLPLQHLLVFDLLGQQPDLILVVLLDAPLHLILEPLLIMLALVGVLGLL